MSQTDSRTLTIIRKPTIQGTIIIRVPIFGNSHFGDLEDPRNKNLAGGKPIGLSFQNPASSMRARNDFLRSVGDFSFTTLGVRVCRQQCCWVVACSTQAD